MGFPARFPNILSSAVSVISHHHSTALYFLAKWLTNFLFLSHLWIFHCPKAKTVRTRWNSSLLGHHFALKLCLIMAKTKWLKSIFSFSSLLYTEFSRDEEIRLDVSFSRIILINCIPVWIQENMVMKLNNFHVPAFVWHVIISWI